MSTAAAGLEPLVLYQLPSCWALPNPSPFCMKLETWLRMAGVPYRTQSVINRPPASKTRKIPYVRLPDGALLHDSSFIIEHLSRRHALPRDRRLTPTERATALLIQRLVETHLYFVLLYERWVPPENWPIVRRDYFATASWPVRTFAPPLLRQAVVLQTRAQGLGRLERDQITAAGRSDVEVLSTLLGSRPFFFDEPSTTDAIVFATLGNLLRAPLNSRVADALREHDNLVRHTARMFEQYFPELVEASGAAAPTTAGAALGLG